MGNYEIVYILDASLSEEKTDELISTVEKVVQDVKSVVIGTQKVGKKIIPTTFKKHKNVNVGYYVITNIQAEADKIKDINKKLKLKETIIRYMIVKQKVTAKEETVST